jgi:hypothetical protein
MILFICKVCYADESNNHSLSHIHNQLLDAMNNILNNHMIVDGNTFKFHCWIVRDGKLLVRSQVLLNKLNSIFQVCFLILGYIRSRTPILMFSL